MKIIKSSKVKAENSINQTIQKYDAKATIAKLIKVDESSIQYVKSERDNLKFIESSMHPLIKALHLAYSAHVPVVISPDMIWYCISSGVAVHINKNSEELRHQFVNHEGKKRIEVSIDDFVFGEANPWNEVVDEFCSKVKNETKNGIVDKLKSNFSTTTAESEVVSQIVIMDAMQSYFEFYCSTVCGIPEIRLVGTKSDWQNIIERVEELSKIISGLDKWLLSLKSYLNEFVNAFDDKIDENFWEQIYKVSGGSGGPFITGWIIKFFPYLKDHKQNPYCWRSDIMEGPFAGLTTDQFDYYMNQVPFIWNFFGTEINMLFVGGLVGVHVNENDSALEPIFAYAVTEDKKN
jgi:hypothetical protein